jgi:hypothetical protein
MGREHNVDFTIACPRFSIACPRFSPTRRGRENALAVPRSFWQNRHIDDVFLAYILREARLIAIFARKPSWIKREP